MNHLAKVHKPIPWKDHVGMIGYLKKYQETLFGKFETKILEFPKGERLQVKEEQWFRCPNSCVFLFSMGDIYVEFAKWEAEKLFDQLVVEKSVHVKEEEGVCVEPHHWFRAKATEPLFLLYQTTDGFIHSQELIPCFVYGSLREGLNNYKLFFEGKCERIPGVWETMNPYAMFIGRWPVLIEKPEDGRKGPVKGELYMVKGKEQQDAVDDLESGYRKEVIQVSLLFLWKYECNVMSVKVKLDGNVRNAIVYFGETCGWEDKKDLKYVEGGDLMKSDLRKKFIPK